MGLKTAPNIWIKRHLELVPLISLDPERVAALRSPAGLDIGSVTSDEIALSIFADIVRERRRGRGLSEGEAGEEAKPAVE